MKDKMNGEITGSNTGIKKIKCKAKLRYYDNKRCTEDAIINGYCLRHYIKYEYKEKKKIVS